MPQEPGAVKRASGLKIRNELRKKRTILALGGSVTRRRFTEPARAAVGFIRHSAAAGISNRLLSPAPGLLTVARTANLLCCEVVNRLVVWYNPCDLNLHLSRIQHPCLSPW